jgi:hypothetical protein
MNRLTIGKIATMKLASAFADRLDDDSFTRKLRIALIGSILGMYCNRNVDHVGSDTLSFISNGTTSSFYRMRARS